MTAADTTAGARSGPWRAEARAMLGLGIPMALTQLVQFSIQTIDVLMIGRLGAEPLGSASLGLVVFFSVVLAGMGPAMAISPLVSQAIGADRSGRDDVRRSVRMGLWGTVFLFPAALVVCYLTEPIALALGQPPVLASGAAPYVLALAPGLPFMLGVMILRNFLAALGKTRMPLVFIVVTTVFNAFVNYLLIFGAFGFPRLELVGAGLASSLSHALGFVLLVVYIRRDAEARPFEVFRGIAVPDWQRLKEIVALGAPISVSLGFEVMLFNAAVFVVGRIGVDEVAAYQIALNVAAIGFMGPLGLSLAGGTRVGLAAGAGDVDGIRRAAVVSIVACVACILIVAIPVMANPETVAGFYLDAADPANASVIALVAGFLPVVAGFAAFDAFQVAAHQALRGLKDVRLPVIFCGVSYWCIGFPLAWWLALGTDVGAVGVWWGLMAALASASVLLGGRLAWLVGRGEAS